jgi:uncharacterized protein (DUF1499 family)
MIYQNLIIYEFDELFEILDEIKQVLNFTILNASIDDLPPANLSNLSNYIIVTKKNIPGIKNQYILNETPIKIFKLIEKLNIQFLKNKFSEQSEIRIGVYKINLNSREMILNDLKLKLTEKEANMIIYLFKIKKLVRINELQFEVWGHQSKQETHTVETHIYRLRKKILKVFDDNNFLISEKNGYQIK